MSRKIIGIILCVMMLMTSFPITALAEDVQQNLPIYNEMESTTGISGLQSGTVTLTQDRMAGDYAVKVATGDVPNQDYVQYTLAESAEFDVSKYSQVKVWVKPGAGAQWIKFYTGNSALIINDNNADGIFKIGEDLVSGQWNEVVLDLTKTSPALTKGDSLIARTNDLSTWCYDQATSVYSPSLTIDASSLLNGQTQVLNGDLQFKPNTAPAGTYNVNPTVLVSNDGTAPATFTRNSEATKEDGSTVSANMPRYEEGYFHNLISDDKVKFEGWSAYGGASITLTQDQAVPEWGATDATRIQTSGGTSLPKYYYVILSPSVSGQSYSESVHIKNIGSTTLRISTNAGGLCQDVLPGEITLVKLENAIGNNISSLQMHFRTLNIDDSLDFIAWKPQANKGSTVFDFMLQSEGKGITVEEGTTNISLYSEQFDNTYWSKTNCTISANAVNSPWGTLTADKLVESAITNEHYVKKTLTISSGVSYTQSCYAKKAERGWLALQTNMTGAYKVAFFDLDSGALGTVSSGLTASIEDVGNGWYRCSVTGTSGTSSAVIIFEIAYANSNYNYAGDGSSGIYLWGAQVEQKAYMTSYMPTTDATATRVAEVLTIPTAGVVDPAEGTWEQWVYVNDLSKRQTPSPYSWPTVFYIPRASGTSYVGIWLYHATNEEKWAIQSRNDANEAKSASCDDSLTPNGWHLFKVVWTTEKIELLIDNVVSATINSPLLPTAFYEKAYIGSHTGSYFFLNTKHDDIRISSIARTGDTDPTRPLPIDEYTTYKMNFDGNLSSLASSAMPNGKISNIFIDSSYFDAQENQELDTLSDQNLILPGVTPTKIALSGNGNKLYYANPSDSNKLYVLNMYTGEATIASNYIPVSIKSDLQGNRIAFKDSANNLYVYDDSTKITTLIKAGVTVFSIQDDGTIYYYEGGDIFKFSSSTTAPGELLSSTTATTLDVSKTGNSVFFSNTNKLYQLVKTPTGWQKYLIIITTDDIEGLWVNSDATIVFLKIEGDLYSYQVSSKALRELDIYQDNTAACEIIKVTNDNKLVLRDSFDKYLVYNPETDSQENIRPTDVLNNYSFDVDNSDEKLAYIASDGLSTYYFNGVERPERYLFSFDGKNSWHTYKDGVWTVVKTGAVPAEEDFEQYGMTIDEVNAMDEGDFEALYADGRQVLHFDAAIYFASIDPFITPSLKSITVTLNGGDSYLGDVPLEKSLYTTKSQSFDAANWRKIRRIYPMEIQPKVAEMYYFIVKNSIYYSYQNNQWTTVDSNLLTDVETNWIAITQQGMTAEELRAIPELDLTNQLAGSGFSVVNAMKVNDLSTEGYNSLITVDYVEDLFDAATLVLKITLTDGTVKQYSGLTDVQVEDFMQWLNERQYNRGPVFYLIKTTSADPGVDQINGFVNYYTIQYVDIEEMQ
ncbi:phage head spike fiber domain-containing protein [Phosphitispora sp. TUW77]|uniref:phage head spike fiber domain-containing protein n=1 Tax=Phosphitispora sp. TUW77 TaxID=3152361 RepID=UPI003AB45973